MNLVPPSQSNYATRTMAKQRYLSHAPIIEALIDVQVEARPDQDIGSLRQALDTVDLGYEVRSPISEGSVEFKMFSDGSVPETKSQAARIGYRLQAIDQPYVSLWRLNGLTLSRLQPYENWQTLETEFRRIWEAYKSVARPERVMRIATRYINNLKLPAGPSVPLNRYLNKLADLPKGVPQSLEGFLQRFVLIDERTTARVILTLALKGATAGEPVPLILDIDASVSASMAPDDKRLWKLLADLHKLKNRVFFKTLSEQAVELYQ